MCGIVGYVGQREVVPLLMDGLRRLEYRGYDSAGVVAVEGGAFQTVKAEGKLDRLKEKLEKHPLTGCYGLGHTRWATHGPPSERNAHPMVDSRGRLALIHNGIIENFLPLKKRLIAEGWTFKSDTDTEVVANLISSYLDGDLRAAVSRAVKELEGMYAFAVVSIETEGQEIERSERVHLLACGTSWHSALIGKFLIENIARVPVEVDYGSEYRYRDPIVSDRVLAVGISQSGETADTLSAMEAAHERGARLFAVCNVLGSQATRISEGVIYTNAGPEIGVASTKAFTTQLVALYHLALYLRQVRTGTVERRYLDDLAHLPQAVHDVIGG